MRAACLLALCLVVAGDSLAASLAVVRAMVEQFEDGPPVYAPDTFTAGETVFFSLQLENFVKKDEKINLTFEAQPQDPQGVSLTGPVNGGSETTLTPEDKAWIPKLRGKFVLPGVLLAGNYQIAITVKDELGNASVKTTLPFRVRGGKLEARSGLSIQKLYFYRNDEDENPLETAAYRAGEEIHARFLIAGFEHGKNGDIHVTYGISLADNAGHVLFAEPAAAHDDSSEFYPKPYVPGILGFSLKPGTTTGDYTLTVTAQDSIGKQEAAVHRTFRLE